MMNSLVLLGSFTTVAYAAAAGSLKLHGAASEVVLDFEGPSQLTITASSYQSVLDQIATLTSAVDTLATQGSAKDAKIASLESKVSYLES